jgi:CRISPR-associated endonuclease/helicase Cas3
MKAGFASMFQDEPFDFQIQVAKRLLEGQSVVLRAPTGAGKTRAALFPFLYARHSGLAFPRQMIYSLPLRTLVTSLCKETMVTCEKAFPEKGTQPSVTMQTGEQPDDPQFRTGDIVFATYDQSLSSFLTIPVGLSRREGNVNAGAMIASYLVFDEFHLMESGRSLATMTAMLEWLKKWTPFLLMTATLSEPLVARLADRIGATVVSVSDADLADIPSQRDKRRVFQVEEKTLTACDVLKVHSHRSIVVCNTVDRAQTLFEQLRDDVSKSGTTHDVILLHSRFLPEDRKVIEARVRAWFGKDPELRRDAILVATQAIEVGLDLTCEHLHTELAPAASVIQRAGRCARFPGEAGIVHIYDVPQNEDGAKSYLPYDCQGEPPLCPATWDALRRDDINGQVIGYRQEQGLIDQVYSKADETVLTDGVVNSRRNEIAGPTGVLTTQDRASYRDLVRFVDSRSFFVHPDPESVENPLRMQTFSVSPGTLAHWYQEFGPFQFDTDWFARLVVAEKNGEDERAQRYIPPSYLYPSVERTDKFYSEFFFVINPKFVDYTATVGLRFRTGGLPPAILSKPLRPRDRFSSAYHLETYQEHIERVWQAYQQNFGNAGRFDYVAEHLFQRHGVAFERLIRSTIAGHDIGKLDDDWQRWVQIWQRDYKRRPVDPNGFYAHTDYDGSTDKRRQAHLNAQLPRPPHAAEGAETLIDVLCEMFPHVLAKAVYTAIVRHHSPGADKVHRFRLSAPAQVEAARVFSLITVEPWQPSWTPLLAARAHCVADESVAGALSRPDGMASEGFLVYLLLARALRISDQQSLDNEPEGEMED